MEPRMVMMETKSMRLALGRYETGWDKGWGPVDGGGWVIEAHAPSVVVLRGDGEGDDVGGGEIRVCPVVREGGRATGVAYVNGQPAALGEWVALRPGRGEELCLEVRVDGSRDGCWNRWLIEGGMIAPPESPRVSYWPEAHLGDALGMLIGCENYARANGTRVTVRATPLFRAILEVFALERVTLAETGDYDDWVHLHPFGYRLEELGWIGGIVEALRLGLGGRVPETEWFPPHRIDPLPEREAVTLVQFDGRSGGQWQRASLRRFLGLYAGRRLAVLGGPDTGRYLGEDLEYRTGDLVYLARQLLACERFVGADSGLAHLACLLGREIDLLPSPAVSGRLVRGIFSRYPRPPVYRSLRETRAPGVCDRRLLLVSTTNGWNLGDDLIRQGVMRLLEIDETRDPVVWLNRCQVEGADADRHAPWSPLWKRLRNLGDRRSLAENARALVVAGTPEWIDTMQPFYQLAVTADLPVWIIGAGGTQGGQERHLEGPVAAGLIAVATVRDEAAAGTLRGAGLEPVRFFDPAFHADAYEPVGEGTYVFNPRLETPEQMDFYRALWLRLRDRIDRIVVHEPMEYTRGCNLFDGEPVFYHSDYRRYLEIYRGCGTYVGGRMHGAIPSVASGAAAHLVCHEGKHDELAWTRDRLDEPEALTLWQRADAVSMDPPRRGQRHDQSRCRAADLAAHREHLAARVGAPGGVFP